MSELDRMYADAARGRSTVYVRATFLREPHVGLRKLIPRKVFVALAKEGSVRAESLYTPAAAEKLAPDEEQP